MERSDIDDKSMRRKHVAPSVRVKCFRFNFLLVQVYIEVENSNYVFDVRVVRDMDGARHRFLPS